MKEWVNTFINYILMRSHKIPQMRDFLFARPFARIKYYEDRRLTKYFAIKDSTSVASNASPSKSRW